MTEMQQLEENAHKEKAKQSMEAVFAYIDEIDELWSVALKEAGRNLNLMIVVVVVQVLLSFFSPLALLCFFLQLILMYRQSKINERIEQYKGKIFGVWKVLYFLGLVSEDMEDEVNKRRRKVKVIRTSPFKRFKELFERVGFKNKQESYG
jgi:hypothetical protein